jgi:hypothetical protein
MTASAIIQQRLSNQYLAKEKCKTPEEVVRWFGAIQAQDYNGAKWALANRTINSTDNSVEEAINTKRILRTHVLRPTWHFISSENIRWMLELTGPRIKKAMGYYHRTLELDNKILVRSNFCIRKALLDHKELSRSELAEVLTQEGISTGDTVRLSHLMMNAELDGIICNGSRRGKQFTYALMDACVPAIKSISREEALARLAKLYFQSHGPAAIKDFVWWSGLPASDAKLALNIISSEMEHIVLEGITYWFYICKTTPAEQSVMLLPNYDEYIVGYSDRDFIFDITNADKLDSRSNPLFQNTILYHGKIIGTWKKDNKKLISITYNLFDKNVDINFLNKAELKLKEYLAL